MDFTLIGTTDVDHSDSIENPECNEEEKAILSNSQINIFGQDQWERHRVDVFWCRALYDDRAQNASVRRGTISLSWIALREHRY